MTISTSSSSVTIGGNGATTAFNFSFVAASASDITVIYTDASGNQTTLSATQYTLSINAPAAGQIWGVGGTVTYPLSGSPIATGTFLTIERIVPLTQVTSISNQGDFYPQAVEKAMDLLEMQIQQINASQPRSVQAPAVDLNPSMTLPAAAIRANKFVGFDSNGNVIAATPSGSGAPVSAAMQPVVGAATLSTARTQMGVAGLGDDNTLTGTQTLSGAAINEAQTTLASATTVNIGAAAANYIKISGATTITAFDTVQAGTRRILEFEGALTLTYNATSLILPGAANITTAAGDVAIMVSEGSGNWRCVSYAPASGKPVVNPSPFSMSYTSPEQTITPAGLLTLAHGLGKVPLFAQARLVCVTADQNYNPGAVVIVNPLGNDVGDSGFSSRGCTLNLDATNITVRFGSNSTSTFDILNGTTGVAAAITNANWQFVVVAAA